MKIKNVINNIKNGALITEHHELKKENIIELSHEEIKAIESKTQSNFLFLKILMFAAPCSIAILSFWIGYTMLFWALFSFVFFMFYFINIKTKFKDKENLFYIKAVCKKRKRGGYRLQYHNYSFSYKRNDGNEAVFVLSSTQKRKYREGNTYIFLLNLKATSLSDISTKNVISSVEI